MKHPLPIDNEIKLNPKRYIVSKTDNKGVIEYGNDYFVEISGYSEEELLGKSHNIIRHPDMPSVIFKLMWERISKGENLMAVVKNLAKDGSYYWVVTDFESTFDPKTNEIVSHTAYRKAAPQKAIEKMIPIYEKLLKLEKEESIESSEKYFYEFLKENGTTYDEFINELVGNSGQFKVFFDAMKKMT